MLTSIFIILLIISQLLCFYIIALLNTKVAKFKDLENHQAQLMREMEESISLYLLEIKEENDRLIQELSNKSQGHTVKKQEKLVTFDDVNHPTSNSENFETNNHKIKPNEVNVEEDHPQIEKKIYVPKVVARNAYNKYKDQSSTNETKIVLEHDSALEDEIPPQLSFEQQVIQLHKEGKTIEEIAKLTNKGMTEIELLLKFQA